MNRLPIGIQDFAKLRKKNYFYADKTRYIFELIDGVGYYFLSRPRRFGKSLLLSTLSELFSGNQALFKGLWIEDKIEWEKYPVIHLSFANSDYKEIGLKNYLLESLQQVASLYQIDLKHNSPGFALDELVKSLYQKYARSVVLLIDEYDKPIIDFLSKDKIHIAHENREMMKMFYSPIKNLDPYLRFFLLTGVSKFSKVSIFSDLNNLKDLTLDAKFSALVGYTEQEIFTYFDEILENIAQTQHISKEALIQNMREWYNGYSFMGTERIYNPFSILNFLNDGIFNNYWFETGTPTFLTKLMAEGGYYDMNDIETDLFSLGNFNIEQIHPIVVLFQTGFLTIKEQLELDIVKLGYPNREVKNTMIKLLLAEFAASDSTETNNLMIKIKRSFENHQLEELFVYFNALFAKIPHQIFEEKLESYYQAVIFLTFTLLGYYADAEVSTSIGRIDAVVRTQKFIYILEFKVKDSAENALRQIKEKKYAEKYLHDDRKILLIGIACKGKTISEYLIEEVK